MMNGSITVESTLGQGTCFKVNLLLPIAENQSSPTECTDEKENPSCYTGNILIAEDNPVNMLVIRTYLEKMGFHTINALNGKEAFEKYTENEVALIFMDVHMPETDGLEATRKIREYEAGKKRTPIIALTADAFSDDKDKCIAEGMDYFLSKPFKPQEIAYVIQRFAPDKAASETADSSVDHPAHHIKQLPAFDRTDFMLRMGNDKKLFDEMILMFVGYFPKYLNELRMMLEQTDFNKIYLLSHNIKGMSGNISACKIQEFATQMEDMAREGKNIEEINRLFGFMESAFKEFCEEVKA